MPLALALAALLLLPSPPVAATLAGDGGGGDDAPARSIDTRLAHADIGQRIAALVSAHPDRARRVVIGESLGGRAIEGLVIEEGAARAGGRPGVLLCGDLDGRRIADAAIVLDVAEHLLARDDLLARLAGRAIVVVPRPAPDGAEARLGLSGPAREQAGNGRPDDADRDGRLDEDGPVDLDGDGAITWMRVPDPEGAWVVDEFDPRAMRKARGERGERGTHALHREGLDADRDGELGEDDGGGAHPDRNFPHGWPAHDVDAGSHPLSEPEALHLARLLLENPGLVPLVVGAQDTLVSLPATAKAARRGGFRNGYSEPLDGVHADDVASMKELQRRFGRAGADASGKAIEHDVEGESLTGGSFLAWAYHQAGRWPLAVRTFAPPQKLPGEKNGGADRRSAKKEGDGTADDTADTPADSSADTDDTDDTDNEADTADDSDDTETNDDAGDQRAGNARKDDADEPTSDPDSPVPAAVLAWLDDERGGDGFAPWTAYEHPDLGAVEIGGLLPGVLVDAPGDDAARLATKLEAYLVELLDALPALAFESLEVTPHGGGVYAVSAALVNTGALPTAPLFASETRTARPVRVTIELPLDAELLHGLPQVLVDRLAGGGGRHELRWVVAATGGQRLLLRADADTTLDVDLEVPLP